MGIRDPGRLQARLQLLHDDGIDLVDQMFRARATRFHDRLKWDVTVDEGHERDVYILRRGALPAMLRVYKRAGWVPKVLNSVDGLVVGQWLSDMCL